ncbi:hypothetical protein [Daejeonella oryzae]|uniref:hypothetical protein n=1 Tax=Daejeonella oryzae TaxID=1122943 RepID=UPI0003FB4788|nr:hypothetical protein [Daejeonella oryzae]
MAGKYRDDSRRSSFDHDFTQVPADERPIIKSCSQIVQEALSKKYWIFDPQDRHWYTPEELLDKYGRITKGAEDFFKRLQIRDPLEGLKAGHQKAEDLKVLVEALSIRVVEYYKNKVK